MSKTVNLIKNKFGIKIKINCRMNSLKWLIDQDSVNLKGINTLKNSLIKPE